MNFEVKHVSDKRFELHREKENLGYLDFHEGVGSLYFDYVFVEPKHRNQEIGVQIVREGIKFAQSRNLTPKPICGYASTVMKRHNWPTEFEE